MTAPPLSFGDVISAGYGYTSILKAIERLILMRVATLPNQYQANFEGITKALWDLGTVLNGVIPPPATSVIAAQPPGWNNATGSYNPGQAPGDGSFWFDTRQGRLFVSQGGEWHQTNGAEAFAHIGAVPPTQVVPGAIWFDTRQGVTFIFLDEVPSGNEPGWYQLNGGGAGGAAGAKALGELSDVTDTPVLADIPASDQVGVVIRDRRSRDGDKTAYRVASRLDLGSY